MKLTEFCAWLTEVGSLPGPIDYMQIARWAQESGKSPEDWDAFRNYAQDSFTTMGPGSSRGIAIGGFGNKDLTLTPTDRSSNFIGGLSISSPTGPVKLAHFQTQHLEVHSGNAPCSVQLTNLWINNLYLNETRGDYLLIDCYIGTLNLSGSAARDFSVSGGAILDIRCAPPTQPSPFTGSVYFDRDVYLPRKPGVRLTGPQPYRNLRSHMMKLENAPMASLFHSLEQSIERYNETVFNKSISWLYEIFSDFGSSTLRPFLWLLLLLEVTFVAIYISDGASTALHSTFNGWQTSLEGDTLTAQLGRAIVLTLGATFNPLSIFGTTSILIAKSAWLTIWLLLHGIFSAIFAALFIFALRRRFKIT